MVSVLVYLGNRFLYRLVEFLRHWYRDGFLFFSHRIINFLEKLDRSFALSVTRRHLFKPLYQNYTFIGYFLGFLFRSIRLTAAGLIYALIILIGLAFYLFWAFIPIFILIKILT